MIACDSPNLGCVAQVRIARRQECRALLALRWRSCSTCRQLPKLAPSCTGREEIEEKLERALAECVRPLSWLEYGRLGGTSFSRFLGE